MSDKVAHKIEVKEAKKIRKFAMPVSLNLILLALGICLVIWADKVTSLISIAIGATFLVCAIYNFIAWARIENRSLTDNTKLFSAIALSIAGGFLIIQNGFIKEVISIIIGIFLLIESIFRMQDALASKKFNPNYQNALSVFGKIIVPDLMMQVLGIILIIFAVVDMSGGVMVNKSAKTVSSKVIDEK